MRVALLGCLDVIRDAQPSDLDAVLRLYRQLNPDDPVLTNGADTEAFAEIVRTPRLRLLVLELDDAVVGTTYLNVMPNLTRSATPYAVIENVVIDESLRGKGFGKQLMAATLEAAWDAGCYKAMLMTGSKNPATHAFYKSCGFSGDVKTAYQARRPSG